MGGGEGVDGGILITCLLLCPTKVTEYRLTTQPPVGGVTDVERVRT